jgi:hypothetical protein
VAVTTQVPTGLLSKLVNAEVDYDTHSIKLLLATSSFVFDQDADAYLGDTNISGTEVSGTGYTAGGKALTT